MNITDDIEALTLATVLLSTAPTDKDGNNVVEIIIDLMNGMSKDGINKAMQMAKKEIKTQKERV